jgi:hypothetical protein
MKIQSCGLCIFLMFVAVPCGSQDTKTGAAETSGACSPAVTGNNNQFTINCQGLSTEQGTKMLRILNKILANQLDPEAVMTKLDEILKAVNPNTPVKTYFCNGMWRTAGPGKNAGFEISMGGDDSTFQEMVRLNNSQHYSDLLKLCLSQIQSAPGWLTPRLFCSLAYLGLGDRPKAKEMLKEFDAKTGPAYDTEACSQASTYLHNTLQ